MNYIVKKIWFVLAIISFVFALYPQNAEAKSLRLSKKVIQNIDILDCLKRNYDKNQDGKLSNRELKKVTCIDLTTVKSTKELKYLLKFPYLKKLAIHTRNIKTLKPLTKLKRLKMLTVIDDSHKIKEINLNQFHNLKWISISAPLTKLTVSKKKKMSDIALFDTKLKTISITNMKYLESLTLSKNTKLQFLKIANNSNLKRMDFENASKAKKIQIQKLPKLRQLILENWNDVKGLNIDDVSKVEDVTIYHCSTTALDYKNMTSLKKFHIYSKEDTVPFELLKSKSLEELNVMGEQSIHELNLDVLPKLKRLYWQQGVLDKIQLTDKSKLELLSVRDNNLSGDWDMSEYTNLYEFDCGYNYISSINMRNSKKIYEIFCDNNNLQLLDVYNAPSLSLLNAKGNPNAELYIARKPSGDEWHSFDSTAKVHYNPAYKNYPF